MKTWKDWAETHQPFELNYHLTQGIAWCDDDARFWGFWAEVFAFVKPEGERLDVGCGPRPPFGEGTVIDPLAEQYRPHRPSWWEGITAYSQPAEEFIPELEGNFDTVLCWNCLDHTIGWKDILENLKRYGAKDAVYAIATDFNPPHTGHPGFDRDDFLREVGRHFRVVRERENFQERDLAMVLCGR